MESDAVTNGWGQYSKLVLAELVRLNSEVEKIHERLGVMREDIIALKVKAGLGGAIAGAIAAAIISVLMKNN